MSKDYIHFGPFHREIRGTIVSILEHSNGSMQLKKLKELVKERRNYDLQERTMTFEEVETDPNFRNKRATLFRYKDGIIYLN